jgi:sulfonate transport system permease protein
VSFEGGRRIFATRRSRLIGGAILPVVILVAWQLFSTSGMFTIAQLPTPVMVVQAGFDLSARGQLGLDIAISTQRVIIGFLIGAGLGLALGAIVGLSRLWDVLLGSTLGAIRAVPSLAWVPLLILWLKIGEDSKITLIAIGAFFPVFTTVAASLKHVDRQLVEAGRAYGLRGVKLFTTIQLPAVLPAVISGLRLALAQAWLFLVAAELIASSMGLGFLLINSQNTGRTDQLFLAIILLAVIGKLSDAVLSLFERWAWRKWG